MLKNHWNTLKICLFGQSTEQPLKKKEKTEKNSL